MQFPTAGKTFFLDLANGNDENTGLTIDKAFKTLPVAYAALTANQNDVLYYLAGSSSINLSEAFTWSKSYTHFIGICAPTHVGQRARIFQTSTATGLSPLVTISGSGCIWQNLYIFQGVADATSLINVRVSGQRNYFLNVHFAGGGHATQAVNGGASLNLYQPAAENVFENCTIGVDTIAAATGMDALLFSGGTATLHVTRNIFKNCRFMLKAGNGGAAFVEMMTINDIDRFCEFENCLFVNLASTAIDSAFVIPAGIDPNDKRILLRNCRSIGASKWDANDRGMVYGDMDVITPVDLSGSLKQLVE